MKSLYLALLLLVTCLSHSFFAKAEYDCELNVYKKFNFGNTTYEPGNYSDKVYLKMGGGGAIYIMHYSTKTGEWFESKGILNAKNPYHNPINLDLGVTNLDFSIKGRASYSTGKESYSYYYTQCEKSIGEGKTCSGSRQDLYIKRPVREEYYFNFIDSMGVLLGDSHYLSDREDTSTQKGVCVCR